MTTILELADEYAKEYFIGRPEDARKRLHAAIINAETEAHNAVLKEREACAVVCETQSGGGSYQVRDMLARTIRARGAK